MHVLISALNAANYSPSIYALPILGVMVAVLMLGVLALLREGRTFVSASFFLISLTLGFWLFCFSALYLSDDAASASWWAHVAYFGIPGIAAAAYQFTVAVLRSYARHRRQVWLCWLLAALFSVAGVSTNDLVVGMYTYPWGFYPRYSWLGVLFCLYFFGALIACLVHYWHGYRAAPPGMYRLRIRWFIIAYLIAYMAAVDFFAVFGVPIYPVGYLPMLGFVMVSAWTIWRYHLVDITPAFAAPQILATMTDALLVLDTTGVIRVVNQAATALLGRPKADLVGHPISDLLDGTPLAARIASLQPGAPLRDFELSYRLPEGSSLCLNVSASMMLGRHDEPAAMVCILQDLTEREQAAEEILRLNATLEARVQERTALLESTNRELAHEVAERTRAEQALQRLALVDELTGLWNRRELERLLDDEIARSQRFHHPLTVLMVDVDRFKDVNDSHGHLVGDSVLRWIAGVLRENVRSTDRVARYGGEELVIVLPETSASAGMRVAEQIRLRLVAWPFSWETDAGERVEIPITVSIGVAAFADDGTTKAGLIAAADEALYEAKRRGRNCTVTSVCALAATDRA